VRPQAWLDGFRISELDPSKLVTARSSVKLESIGSDRRKK
jgi:hypothetical protein